MPVSAYVIRCTPGDLPGVRQRLLEIPEVALGEPTDTGLPLSVYTPTHRAATELGDRLQVLPGVRAAVLVYHNFEDLDPDSKT
ncbi:MAG: chaperone NapD [Verrucomicrobiales bacterium]|nr:chaperone NapD [Verrucomicrobiales bacterium]